MVVLLPIAAGFAAALAFGPDRGSEEHLPPIPFPPENPYSEEKRVLGKILFFEEQLSADNTMACATCHVPGLNTADPRRGRHTGLDGIANTPDDKLGSPGVIATNEFDEYEPVPRFGLRLQVTDRTAPTVSMAMYAPEIFWDGRAGSEFRDPITGDVLIAAGGALENQAIGPPMSDVEMAHFSRNWPEATAKIAAAKPLALASDLPPDMEAALASYGDYGALFEAAFGTPEVTASRIAFALATYQRTLFADQTPWDGWMRGDFFALTPDQRAGLEVLEASFCAPCHMPPMWTDFSFRNIGLRPTTEDLGRQNVTGLTADRGKFKVPSLRNVGLQDRFMHNGQLGTINEVFDFYARRNGQVSFPDNRDGLVGGAIAFNPTDQARIIDFLVNGLTDPRVANEEFPFDRPTLHSQQPAPNPALLGGERVGTNGIAPQMIANRPPLIGDGQFRVGLDRGLGGATAWLVVSTAAPVGGTLIAEDTYGPFELGGLLPGEGYATAPWPIASDASLDGTELYMQWLVEDPGAAGGEARSRIARLTFLCGRGGCATTCPADFNMDGVADFFDVQAFLKAFTNLSPQADLVADGEWNFFDVQAYLTSFSVGCP
jgi:cytochrome c peroxidase